MAVKLKEVKKTLDQDISTEQDIKNSEYQSIIAEAAYSKAESRGFELGHELEDWLEAEKEVLSKVDKS